MSGGRRGEIARSLTGGEPPGQGSHRRTQVRVAMTTLFERPIFEDRWFEHKGIRIHYEVFGAGTRTVVLVHGILLDSRMNHRLATRLAGLGYRVVLIDLPGHGRSDKPTRASDHRIDRYANDVIALMDDLGADDVVVGGFSLGADVALQVAVRAPTRVRGMVLEMPVLERAVPAAALAFVPSLLFVHYAKPVVRTVGALLRRLPRTGIDALDGLLGVASLTPEEITAVIHGVLVGPIAPTAEERRALDVPALVIGHRADLVHPFSDARYLARQMRHAQLIQSHTAAELRLAPQRLSGAVGRFLAEVWAPRTTGAAAEEKRPA